MHDPARMPTVLSALRLAKAGSKIFPVKPNSKEPAIKGWQTEATSDPDKIGAWWKDNPNYNIGIHTIDRLVVDLDVKDGGLETWRDLVESRELLDEERPETETVRTPSGGFHLCFSLPPGQQVGNSVRKLGPGIDTRGKGGYVLGPGSSIDGKFYELVSGKKKAMYAPDWLVARSVAPKTRTVLSGVRLNEETPEAEAAAEEWIAAAPRPPEGERNTVAYQVATRAFDFGIELSTGHHLMSQWNEDVGLEEDELQTTVESAYKNRSRPIGVDNPGVEPAGFDRVDLGPGEEASIHKAPADAKRHRWEFIDPHESRAIALEGRNPLVEGVVYEGEIDVTYGKSGSRKSIFTMDMDYHIWMGRDWYGRKVTQGPTLWVGAEGGKGVHLRNETMWAFHKPEGPPLFGLLQASMNLLRSKEDFQALLGAMQRKQDAWKRQVVKITIDTLTAVSAGGDLNGPDMTAMLERAWIIREKMGMPHMTLIHHPGKDQTKGMRGSQTMYDGVDTTIFIKKETKRSGTAYLGKQRDGEDDMELLRFMAKDVPLPPDNKGRPRSGQVIVARVVEGMAEVERTILEQRPWEELGVSESTYWRRKRQGKL